MTAPIPPLGASAAAVAARAGGDQAKLREAAQALEGMFVRQLFSAMRATVPSEGLTHGGAGEEMFTAMLDEHFADALPGQWARGITGSLLRELAPATVNPPDAVPDPR